ncbi:MAG TPA: site-2 protease family protein [Candidatus Saccharimonadales bacterium]|nr:site-2 protease family protein [Candidatus Saccharimonadales bacterium]
MLSDLPLQDIIIVLLSLVFSLGIHEATHAFVAHRLGDNTAYEEGRLTLNPLKHIDVITTVALPAVLMLLHLPPILIAKPVPIDSGQVKHGEYGLAAVALAGPFSNLALAVVASILLHLGIAGFLGHILVLFMLLNVGLFVFNMLPIPPLDGSRLLYAFAPEPVQRVMQQIEALGFMFLIIILLALSSFISPIISYLNQFVIGFLV